MNVDTLSPNIAALRHSETWHQDPSDPDLWHHREGLIVNSAALAEREAFFSVIRIGHDASAYGQEQHFVNLQA